MNEYQVHYTYQNGNEENRNFLYVEADSEQDAREKTEQWARNFQLERFAIRRVFA